MPGNNHNIEELKSRRFPLLPYSQLVWDMLQESPDVYNFSATVYIDKSSVNIKRLKDAFVVALQNHPVFSMVIDSEGMQHFQSHEDILHGQFHSIDIEEDDKEVRLIIQFNRILGDGYSFGWLLQEVFSVYGGKTVLEDNYLEYLSQTELMKQSVDYNAHKEWLNAEFGGLDIPVRPSTDIPLDADIVPKCGCIDDNYTEYLPSLENLTNTCSITHSQLISLCVALAIMDYNGTNEAALTWAYMGREEPEEMTIFGSLHKDIPLKFSRETRDGRMLSKNELLQQLITQVESGINNSSYPFTLTPPNTETWNYAVNVLDQLNLSEMFSRAPFDIVNIESRENEIAYALLDVELYHSQIEKELIVNYRYSATHYKPDSIRKFADLVKKNCEKFLS